MDKCNIKRISIKKVNHKVWICFLGNLLSMISVLILIVIYKDPKSKYFRFGPNEDLIVISVVIDTWIKWTILAFFVGLIKGCDVIVNELGTPILGFRIFNPDCKQITDFTKNELNFLGNSMSFVNCFREILMVIVTISQFDIALLSLIMSEIVSIFTVRHLLNEKSFIFDDEEQKLISENDLVEIKLVN